MILSPSTILYFDHQQEPDPEERGMYWAVHYSDTRKVFGFMPDSFYDNIDEEIMGKPLSKKEACDGGVVNCIPLTHPDNMIGKYCLHCDKWVLPYSDVRDRYSSTYSDVIDRYSGYSPHIVIMVSTILIHPAMIDGYITYLPCDVFINI